LIDVSLNPSTPFAPPLTDNLGKDHPSCNRKVERFDLSGSWNLDHCMATLPDGMAEALALTPENKNQIPIPIKMIEGLLRLSSCTDNPETLVRQKIQRSPQIDHLGNKQGNIGSGASLKEFACDLCGAVLGQDQTVNAKKCSGSDKGAQIPFVCDVIGYNEECATPFLARLLNQVFDVCVGEEGLCKSNKALVGGSRHDGLYFTERFEVNRNTLLGSKPCNLLGPCSVPARPNPHLTESFRGLEETLPHSMKAGN